MFETLYNQIDNKLTNYRCLGCNGNKANNRVDCQDLNLMFKVRINEKYKGKYIEEYNCDRKVCAFVKKYGAAYISEIYRYLEAFPILSPYNNNKLKFLVLGCGFDPWYYAVKKYINDYNLNINFSYMGYDNSNNWDIVRQNYENVEHKCIDLTIPCNFDFNPYDFVIVDKCFSTINRMATSDKTTTFLKNICNGFYNINKSKTHTLLFREQAYDVDISKFDSFVNRNINWQKIDYSYMQGKQTEHLDYIINYVLKDKDTMGAINNKNIYGSPYNNGFDEVLFNTFFIRYIK